MFHSITNKVFWKAILSAIKWWGNNGKWSSRIVTQWSITNISPTTKRTIAARQSHQASLNSSSKCSSCLSNWVVATTQTQSSKASMSHNKDKQSKHYKHLAINLKSSQTRILSYSQSNNFERFKLTEFERTSQWTRFQPSLILKIIKSINCSLLIKFRRRMKIKLINVDNWIISSSVNGHLNQIIQIWRTKNIV